MAKELSYSQRRAQEITLLTRELLRELEVQSKRFNDAFVGRSEQILVEGAAKRGEGMMMGRTRTHRKVVFKGAKELKGQIVNVKIASAGVSALLGYLP